MKPICSLTSRHLNEDPPNKDKVVENVFGSVKLQPAVRAMSFRPTVHSLLEKNRTAAEP
jgi:formaldehyde-activating enzyme involved in methanogenesis